MHVDEQTICCSILAVHNCNRLNVVFASHRYLIVGLTWINSVLKNWREELRASGYSGSAKLLSDR